MRRKFDEANRVLSTIEKDSLKIHWVDRLKLYNKLKAKGYEFRQGNWIRIKFTEAE